MYGTKDLNRFYGMFMASLGFTVVGMNYRLLPDADLRDQVQDIFASLHWLDAHGREHHGDTDRVFLTGDSAGGHLATLVTCIEASKPLQEAYGVEPFKLKIRAIAVNHGACDASLVGFTKGLVEVLATHEIRGMMLGKKKKKAPWYGKISFTETAEGIALPPLMLITSEQDPLNVQTFSMEQYLKSHHIPYRMKLWKKEQGERLGHVFNIGNPEWPESIETNRETGDFFKEVLAKK
jgi:acetyl esterase/lipase